MYFVYVIKSILKTDLNVILKMIMINLLHGVKATKFKLGLLVNFGEPSLKYERFVNEYK